MKLAIGIATYQRADGTTPIYLSKALASIVKQIHQDYKVFLIGDKYENNNEFEAIAKSIIPQEKIYFENRSFAPERDRYKLGSRELWCSGGVGAYNHAIDIALNQGFDYMCHLDHDDYWSEDHLSSINYVIENTQNSALIYTCSKHIQNQILPRGVSLDDSVCEHIPIPANIVHSSVCINHKLISLKYRDVYLEEGRTLEADMDMWYRVKDYLSKNSHLKSYLIKRTTCFHELESH